MKLIETFIIAFATFTSCQNQSMSTINSPGVKNTSDTISNATVSDDKITYLALGDSYTIGESVKPEDSYPYQLAALLKENKLNTEAPQIIARTGWTTEDLKQAIAEAALKNQYSFVTLLIGVNNQYQNLDIDKYRTDFDELVKTAIKFVKGGAKHVFVLSIPDYSVTPFAQGSDLNKIETELVHYNSIAETESKRLGVSYTNITPVSLRAKNDQSLTADDGLHPSPKMYALWVQELLPKVISGLAKR